MRPPDPGAAETTRGGATVAPRDQLLERGTVLAELDQAQRAVSRGGGRLVLLRGEAGVGKTAVIARFVAGLGQRARVLRGWCDPLAAPRPPGPLIDMLAETSGEQEARSFSTQFPSTTMLSRSSPSIRNVR